MRKTPGLAFLSTSASAYAGSDFDSSEVDKQAVIKYVKADHFDDQLDMRQATKLFMMGNKNIFSFKNLRKKMIETFSIELSMIAASANFICVHTL